MSNILYPLHISAISLMILLLVVESLALSAALAPTGGATAQGQRKAPFWRKVHLMGYHTVMLVVVLTGMVQMMKTDALSQGGWLHAKLTLFLVLLLLGGLIGRQWKKPSYTKTVAMTLAFNVVAVSAAMVYLALARPF